MNSLLRQWPVIEAVLVPALMMLPAGDPLLAWNMGHVDDALAVSLCFLQLRATRPGRVSPDLRIFQPGLRRLPKPIEWSRADLRGTAPTGWLQPSGTGPGRWMPKPDVLERVVLAPPPSGVDLLVCGRKPSGPSSGGPGQIAGSPDLADAIATVRQGGLIFCTETAPRPVAKCPDLERHGSSGRLFRKLGPARRPGPGGGTGSPASLLQLHEQAVLIRSHIGLAKSLARRFAHRGERMDDLEQVALAALVGAAGRYDPGRGHPFGAFAGSCILGELKRHFRDKLWSVRVPRSLQEMHLAVRTARDELAQESGRSPTINEIAGHLGTSDENVLAAMEAGANCWALPLETSTDDDRAGNQVSTIDAGFDHALDRDLLKQSLSKLNPAERRVIKEVFFDGRTQRQIAEELGVSQMQVSRLVHRTLAKLRESMRLSPL